MGEMAAVLTVVGLALWVWVAVTVVWGRFRAGKVSLHLSSEGGLGALGLVVGIVSLLACVLSLWSGWDHGASSSEWRGSVMFLLMGFHFTMRYFSRPRFVENGIVLDSGLLLRWDKLQSFVFEPSPGGSPVLRIRCRGFIPWGGEVLLGRIPPDSEERARRLLLDQGVVEA